MLVLLVAQGIRRSHSHRKTVFFKTPPLFLFLFFATTISHYGSILRAALRAPLTRTSQYSRFTTTTIPPPPSQSTNIKTSSMALAPPEAIIGMLEGRAENAEKALAELQKATQQLQQASSPASSAHLVAQLKELLSLMNEDRVDAEAIRAQRDDLKEENARLRTQCEKHNYRITHLLRTIEELENGKKE